MNDKVVELNREYWGRVHDMCAGTNVKPWECVKLGDNLFDEHPRFDDDLSEYVIAVAVLEDRPVFVGDTIYYKCDGEKLEIVRAGRNGDIIIKELFNREVSIEFFTDDFTWTPPATKRTFRINDDELPCPVSPNKDFTQTGFNIDNVPFCFNSFKEAVAVKQALVKLLTEARDK